MISEQIEVSNVTKRECILALKDIWSIMVENNQRNISLPEVFPEGNFTLYEVFGKEELLDGLAAPQRSLVVSLLPSQRERSHTTPIDKQIKNAFSLSLSEHASGVTFTIDFLDPPITGAIVRYRELVEMVRAWALDREREQAADEILNEMFVGDSEQPARIEPEDMPAVSSPETVSSDKPKRREIARVSGGLIYWYHKVSDLSINDAAENLNLPKSRYYKNPQDIYTDADVVQLNTTWAELLDKWKQGAAVFETFVRKKLLEREVKRE